MKKPIQQALDRQLSFEVSSLDVQRLFMDRAKVAITALGLELLEQDARKLAGAPFSRKNEELLYRGGSAKTSLLVDGGKVQIERPRIKDRHGHEVALPIMEKLRDQDLLDEQIASRLMLGASTRNYQPLVDSFSKKTGVSKSAVSRAFVRASQKDLDAINNADLSAHKFVGLVVDGTYFGDKIVIVAAGITNGCQKIPLGIREGSTENAAIVKDLLSSVVGRGFAFSSTRLLAILDGSKALKAAVKSLWGDNVAIQRCWLHKLRNIRDYLPKENHAQLAGRMKKIMGLNSLADAQTELRRLREWLESISHDAVASLDECGSELLSVHALGITGVLRSSLTTTNSIESLIGVVKRKARRVSNWGYHPKLKTKIPRDKILRWVASSIQAHRSKLRRLRGFENAAKLVAALNRVDQMQILA